MKRSGIAYPAQKMFFYFLTLMTMKKRLDRINDLIDGEHSSSYFDISNLLTAAFLKISSMELIFPLWTYDHFFHWAISEKNQAGRVETLGKFNF